MKIYELLKQFQGSKATLKPNYKLIHCNVLKPTNENAELFNELLDACKEAGFNDIPHTEKTKICKLHLHLPAFSYTYDKGRVELIILIYQFYRIQFRADMYYSESNKILSGNRAFKEFKKHLLKYNINLDDYAVENGKDYNDTTEKYIINIERRSFEGITFEGEIHHIDFHSSFPSGLVNTHPEFKDAINELYIKRKENELYKGILNMAIGYMHSKMIKWKFANLSKDAINDNNRRIRELSEKLKKSGRMPILYNTDGIWYYGPEYHGEGEGDGLCQWHNDHHATKFRAKSKGAYEFIEDGKYYPVIRGRTTLDSEKPREQWIWGDIYNGEEIIYNASENGLEVLYNEKI